MCLHLTYAYVPISPSPRVGVPFLSDSLHAARQAHRKAHVLVRDLLRGIALLDYSNLRQDERSLFSNSSPCWLHRSTVTVSYRFRETFSDAGPLPGPGVQCFYCWKVFILLRGFPLQSFRGCEGGYLSLRMRFSIPDYPAGTGARVHWETTLGRRRLPGGVLMSTLGPTPGALTYHLFSDTGSRSRRGQQDWDRGVEVVRPCLCRDVIR